MHRLNDFGDNIHQLEDTIESNSTRDEIGVEREQVLHGREKF